MTPRAWGIAKTPLSTKTTIVEFTILLLCTKEVVRTPVKRPLTLVEVNWVRKVRKRKPRMLDSVLPSNLRPSMKILRPRVKLIRNKKMLIGDPMSIFLFLEWVQMNYRTWLAVRK
jgi:hypothetical protein